MSSNFNPAPEKPTYSCAVCNAEWTPKKKDGLPKRCPRCKSKLWNTCFKHECIKCSYNWLSANAIPDRCPQCQSKKWHDGCETPAPLHRNTVSKDIKRPILLRYDAGVGCIKIAADLCMTFSEVFEIVKDTYPDIEPRL